MRNKFSSDVWNDFRYFLTYKDENGNIFKDRSYKYVGFDKGRLIGYFDEVSHLENAYLKETIHESDTRLKDYKGIPEEIRQVWEV